MSYLFVNLGLQRLKYKTKTQSLALIFYFQESPVSLESHFFPQVR